jgi:hypothetical protein
MGKKEVSTVAGRRLGDLVTRAGPLSEVLDLGMAPY